MKDDDALPEGTADKLAEAFKSYADKDEAARFVKSGWAAMSNDTLRDFFASKGVKLAEYDDMGWSTQTLVEGNIEFEEGNTLSFIKKSFQTKPTTPFPDAPALEGALSGYYAEMSNAAKDAVEAIRAEAGAKNEVSKEASAPAPTAEELPDDEGNALDDLLSDIGDEMELDG
jgi:hypothetical protein